MPDFGFVGPSYEAPSIYQDAQELINWRPEIDPNKGPDARGVIALYPTPGLTTQVVLPNTQEVRGMRTVSGGQQMVAVCGPYVYVLTSNLTPTIIGQLNTSSGHVGITDNGVNVYIVDGAYRYTWRINTPTAATIQASISGTTLTVSRTLSGTLAIGQALYGIGLSNETVILSGSGTTWTLNKSQTIASSQMYASNTIAFMGAIADVTVGATTYHQLTVSPSVNLYLGQTIVGTGVSDQTMITQIVTAGSAYYINKAYTISSEQMYALNFTQIPNTDGAFTGADVVDTVDNYFVYNNPGTQQWAASNTLSPITAALSFSSKDGSPDNLVSLIVDHREVYLLGENSSEVWVDVGSFPFPLQRVPGTNTQHGIVAKFSVSRLGNSFAYVSRNIRGQAQIMMMQGYMPTRISTHAVENTLVNQKVDDAIAWTYQLEGHEVYVVSFPTLDLTWAYDVSTQMWHKWLYVDNNNVFHRHRGNCLALFQGMVLVGDWQNGKIYELDPNNYTDDGDTIRRVRRCPHLVSDLQREFFDELQLQFQPGVGQGGTFISSGTYLGANLVIPPTQTYSIPVLGIYIIGNSVNINTTNPYTNPQAMLRWSNDGGSTWSREYWIPIGQQGKYKNRAIWRRLGTARDRVYEVVMTDPVKAVIVSANLKSSVGEN